MHKYRLVTKKGEGTFSEVIEAQSVRSGKRVAIKCMKSHFETVDQVNNLREIQALRRLSPHANIVRLIEVLFDEPTGRLALVFELMQMNVYELIRDRRTPVGEGAVLQLLFQLLRAMDHMHRHGVFHRDIKPENILLNDTELKLGDFGSCRGVYSRQPYTEYISTRWYRAPECLLTDGWYGYKMDIWGVGCVFFEILALYPLFPGTNELDQIEKIHDVIGTPSQVRAWRRGRRRWRPTGAGWHAPAGVPWRAPRTHERGAAPPFPFPLANPRRSLTSSAHTQTPTSTSSSRQKLQSPSLSSCPRPRRPSSICSGDYSRTIRTNVSRRARPCATLSSPICGRRKRPLRRRRPCRGLRRSGRTTMPGSVRRRRRRRIQRRHSGGASCHGRRA